MKTIKNYINNIELFENKDREFKLLLNKDNPIGWAKTVVAFANEEGGTLYIGVTDTGRAKGIQASDVDDVQKYFVDFVRNKIAPIIDYEISTIQTDEETFVLCIDIFAHKNGVVVFKDKSNGIERERIFRRYPGSTYELVSIQEIIDYSIQKNKVSYDLTTTKYKSQYYTFNTLNEKYKERTNAELNLTEKQLKSVGLITDTGYLTLAGTYFVDKSPNEFPSIHMRKWPGFNKGSDSVIDAKEYQLNLIEQLDYALKFIKNNISTGIRKGGQGAVDEWSYPEKAIIEALCNAIGHRDYSIRGSQIDIDIYTDRIEIVSPGTFLPDGRAQDYQDIRDIPLRRRNQVITDTFAMCKLMQRYGSGFDKIVEEYEKYDSQYMPTVTSYPSWFKITLMNIKYKPFNIIENVNSNNIKLPEIQKIVYDTIKSNPNLRTPEISFISGLSVRSVDNALRALKHKNLIVYQGTKKEGGYYII